MVSVTLCFRTKWLAIAAIFALFAPLGAAAHEGAEGVVMQRMEMMKSMGKNMKALNAMARGKAPMDAKAIAAAATELRGHSAMLPKMFPEGTNKPPSEAKPEIWQDWDKFRRLWTQLNEKASVLAESGKAGDHKTLAKAFRGVGKVCSSCHKAFRSKKQ